MNHFLKLILLTFITTLGIEAKAIILAGDTVFLTDGTLAQVVSTKKKRATVRFANGSTLSIKKKNLAETKGCLSSYGVCVGDFKFSSGAPATVVGVFRTTKGTNEGYVIIATVLNDGTLVHRKVYSRYLLNTTGCLTRRSHHLQLCVGDEVINRDGEYGRVVAWYEGYSYSYKKNNLKHDVSAVVLEPINPDPSEPPYWAEWARDIGAVIRSAN